MQQILAYETDLLEYDVIFEGSTVIERLTAQIADEARAELAAVDERGGAVAAIEDGYMKRRLVESNARRLAAIETGERVVVGVNRFAETERSPLASDGAGVLTVDGSAERAQLERLRGHRTRRSASEVADALRELRAAVASGTNVMPVSIRCAEAGVTTGEWSDALREEFGEYRPPTGIEAPIRIAASAAGNGSLDELRRSVAAVSDKIGRRLKLLVGKPGLDGHSSGAEKIALAAREAAFEVVYEGIRLPPDEIAASAQQEGVHLVGLSILSGSHLELVPQVVAALDVPVVVGGIIPESDRSRLIELGVAAVYTPKDYDLRRIVTEMVEIAARAQGVD